MKISVISFTRAGAVKNLETVGLLQEKKHQAASYSWHKYTGRKLIPFQSLPQLLADLWEKQDAFLFLADTERVVRAVMPFVKGPKEGPAVLVMDEMGNFVISLLPGRLPGADDWCAQIAGLMDAVPVITHTRGEEGAFSVDEFAGRNWLHVQDIYQIRSVRERLAAGGPVGIYSDYPVDGVLPEGFVKVGTVMNEGKKEGGRIPEVGIAITDDWEAPHFVKECRMYPRNLVLGLYCVTGKTAEELERFVRRVMAGEHLSRERLRAVYSVDRRSCEAGLVQLADRLGIPFFTYTPKQLELPGGAPAGMELVCERCAVLGSQNGRLVIRCREEDGMMAAVCEQPVSLTF